LEKVFKTYQKEEGLVASVKNLWSRKYDHRTAFHPTSLKINEGQIVGLIGANGAGKTTFLKMLSGLIQPTSGSARVLGFDPSKRENDFLRQISILLGQKNQLWWDISPLDSFRLLTKIYDLDESVAKNKIAELAHLLQCEHVLKTQLRRLSLGERMKMELIGALLHSPKVLFLDEPTIGLDIMAQESIRQFLSQYVKEHKPTIILTSHYMDDISVLAHQLLLMSKGKVVYDGTPTHFMDLMQKEGSQEEVDFEEVIMRFLQKESGLF